MITTTKMAFWFIVTVPTFSTLTLRASVHFAGLLEKHSDPVTLWLAPQILGRKPERQICPYEIGRSITVSD